MAMPNLDDAVALLCDFEGFPVHTHGGAPA